MGDSHAVELTDCGACTGGLIARHLYEGRPGPRLLLLQEDRCLNGSDTAPAGRWSVGQVLHVAPSCALSLRHALFAKVGHPVCLEPEGDRLMVVQLQQGRTVRRSGLRGLDWLRPRDDLNNVTLTVVYENYSPFFECEEEIKGTCVRTAYTAPAVLLAELAQRLGFHTRYVHNPDGSWGHVEAGQWRGMVGEVVAGRADLAVGGIFINAQRSAVVDFCRPLTLVYLDIVTRPRPVGLRSSFANLLSPTVLALIMVSLLASTLALLLVVWRQLDNCYRALVSQDLPASRVRLLRNSGAGTMLLGIWLMSGIIHRTAYTSNMISALSAPPATWAPDSLADLVRHEYRVVTHTGYGAYADWLHAQNSSLFQALKRRWVLADHVATFRQLVGSEEKIALLEETPSVMTLLYDAIAESEGAVTEASVHRGRQQFLPSSVGWAMQPNTPYAGRLNEILRWAQSSGLATGPSSC
ncbi:glutamate receptor ionotropic, kainate 1-like [Pollicipes pollicipes]|uniref:glutamate receptor ionotropic, kainate 1-like n=1 Tax=Pollicipes pollicipes TaxID=41117 RepID=UPI001884D4A9|nr:glutamate receptor ionotropic, kainate 1-like [Pollicipes pollicipes]